MKKLLFLFLIIPFLFGCSTTQKSEADFSIKFVVDKKWDTECIFSMFQHNDPAGLANRASTMGIDINFARMIRDTNNYSEVKSSLENLVNNRYREIGNGLRKSANDYSAAWEPCIKEFSDVVRELTQHNWFYNSYTCVVSAFHYGLSNWHGNIITRRFGEDPVGQRYVTANEIVLSHVFHISRKYYDRNEAPDHIIWALSEITAKLILDDNRLLKLWGDDYVPSDHYFLTSGYPQLAGLEEKSRNVYKNSADFNNYLQTTIQLAKEMDIDFSIHARPENTAAFWLLTSIPEDIYQLIPTAMGNGIVIDNSLFVNLVEPFNYQEIGGWWGFTNKKWVGNGEYYILFIPMEDADVGYRWVLGEAQVYVGNDSNPTKLEIDSSNISLSLDQFKKLF